MSVYSETMARPVTISDATILEAARRVFVRDGINATTRAIAAAANVSEGSLFRRFATKNALFEAAVLNPLPPFWVRELDSLAGRGDPRQNLLQITREMLKFAQEMLPLVRLGWGKASLPSKTQAEPTPGIRDRRSLAHYLQREMKAGRLKAGDAEAVSRLLFGGCLDLVMDQSTQGQSLGASEIAHCAEELVNALWHGLAPAPHSAASLPVPEN